MPEKLDYKKMLLEDFEPLSNDNKWKAILYVEALHTVEKREREVNKKLAPGGLKHCSFCGRSHKEVENLVVEGNASICSECAKRAVEIIEESKTTEE